MNNTIINNNNCKQIKIHELINNIKNNNNKNFS